MPKASKPGYYAVRVGRTPGIYLSWPDCDAQVKGFTGAVFKKLATEAEAIDFLAAKPSATRNANLPVASTSRTALVPDSSSTPQTEKDCDVVYCDGACKGNGTSSSVAGIGVWWGHGDPRNISERCPGDQTNNRAELIAIVRILESAPPLQRKLLIKTDSKYSIQCVTSWIFNWMSNGFLAADGKPVKNRALIKYLAALLHARRKTSQTIEFIHVRGHVGIEGNEAADQLANLGATKPTVPERDWESLEARVLQSLKSVRLPKKVDDDLKAYAGGLLDDIELAGLPESSVGNPVQDRKRQHLNIRGDAAHGLAPHDVSLPRTNDVPVTSSRLSSETSIAHNRRDLPSRSSKPTTVAAQSVPSETTISKEELEVYASCLLGEDELSSLGKGGVFDSDF